MTRPLRRLIARVAIALLLFMQLAVAAYACPGVAKGYALSQAAHESGMEMARDCCPTLDPVTPNLCLEHGQQGSHATGLSHPPAPLGVDLPLVAIVSAVEPILAVALPDLPPEYLAHTTAPPPAIRFGFFRS